MGCVTKFCKLICGFGVVILGVLFAPNNLPSNVKFTEFHVTPVKHLGERQVHNELLNDAERLFEGEIKGPEGFEIINGELYTTLHGGFVAKVYEDQIIPVVKFGQPCIGWWEESKCGRPLGIRAYGRDHLIVADAYFGIFKVNIHDKKVTNLVDKNTVIDGKPAKFFNGVEVGSDGSIYWTHSTSDFLLENGVFALLADGSGRLMRYDPATQKNTVLLKDLYCPNGLVLSPNEDFLLVSETGHSRIIRYYLKGPKRFTSEVFIDGLPGMPDNLRFNGRGFFIPLVITRSESTPALFQVISPFPTLRRFLASSLSLTESVLGKIREIYPNYFIDRALHYVGHFESVEGILPKNTIILEVDWIGNLITNYHGSDGSVTGISDVIIHNGYLYLGSPFNNYLARVKLSKLGDVNSNVNMYAAGIESRPPTTTTRPPPPPTTSRPVTTTRPTPSAPTRPPTTTRPPPPPTTTPKPVTTTRPPPSAPTRPPTTTTRPPPPTTTTRPPPPTTTTRPPPPTTTTRPPPTTTRAPPPPPKTTTKPPPPPPTTTRPPPPKTTPPPTHTTSKPNTNQPNSK